MYINGMRINGLAMFFVSVAALASAGAQPVAFPGADGFGKFASGGRGGKVIAVTNLNDDGPESFREAALEHGARTIIFRVSGTIVLKSPLLITDGDLTIAGQTAPGDGICVKNYNVKITANNVIVRFMRFRLGDEAQQEDDALTVMNSKNVIIDHCSMSWGTDEVGSFYDNEDFTLQWNLLYESLNNSVHSKGPHGYGGIWGGMRASFHHNLIAHNTSRNPRFNGGRTSHRASEEQVDFRNNLVYNWGFKCAYGGEQGKQNVVANYFKPGPASISKVLFLEPFDSTGLWYLADNVIEGSPAVTHNNWAGVEGQYRLYGRVDEPFPYLIAQTENATDIVTPILLSVGAALPRRDAADARVVEEVRSGTATYGSASYAKEHKLRAASQKLGIIDSQREVGGWPLLKSDTALTDADLDGIPDTWERAHRLNPADSTDGAFIAANGYTHLEIYLNELAAQVAQMK
ncbi:MAG TPA: pectate lyase [Bacteroidota bacterium]